MSSIWTGARSLFRALGHSHELRELSPLNTVLMYLLGLLSRDSAGYQISGFWVNWWMGGLVAEGYWGYDLHL